MIFGLRITDMSLDTLRMLFMMRGRKALVWTIGFFQSVVYVIAITKVFSNLSNPLTVLGYAAGFATGNVIGMVVEERLAIGHIHLEIISQRHGVALAKALAESRVWCDRDLSPWQRWNCAGAECQHSAKRPCPCQAYRS